MPALKILGRRWHLACDDLVLLSAIGGMFHTSSSACTAAMLSYLEDPTECSKGRTRLAFLVAMLAVDVLMAALLFALSYTSAQGSILDNHRRRIVPVLAALTALSVVPELGVSIWGCVLKSEGDSADDLLLDGDCGESGSRSMLTFIRTTSALHVSLDVHIACSLNMTAGSC